MKRTPEERALRDQAATPTWLFKHIWNEFKPIVDVCATAKNAVVPFFYSEKMDGLANPWFFNDVSCVWMNPPYSNPYPWCKKAFEETRTPGRKVVALLKLDSSTKWWREFVAKGCTEIRLLETRLQFIPAGNIVFSTNNFCNVLAVFELSIMPPRIYSWNIEEHQK